MLFIKDFMNTTGVHVTEKHTGKMTGIQSISTSPFLNPFCEARAKNPAMICSKCYARSMEKHYKNGFSNCLDKNTRILTTEIIPFESLPKINTLFFRFEAFGDLINEIQVINYFNIARVNPAVKCALWTKNPAIIERTINKLGHKKPRNLNIICSSDYLNTIKDFSMYNFVDYVFTVYTGEYIKQNNIDVTCGARSCLFCGKCYTGGHKSKFISEKKK